LKTGNIVIYNKFSSPGRAGLVFRPNLKIVFSVHVDMTRQAVFFM